MKKVFLLAVTAAALSFASCGNKTAPAANGADSAATDSTEVLDQTAQEEANSLVSTLASQLDSKDAEGLQGTIQSLTAKYSELVQSGKLEQAKAYAGKVQAFLNEHAEQIKSITNGNATVAALIEGVKKLPTNAEATVEEAAAAVKSDAQNLVNTAKENAKTAVENKVNEKVDGAKAAANKAVEDANKKANEAVEKANKKANEAVNNAANKAIKGLGL
ncbi:MAG TPA: hypothetical protein VIQ97_01635 [Prevotella sp.]